MDIPALSDPRTSALAHEAGAFAGFESHSFMGGCQAASGASSHIQGFAGILTTV